MEFVIIAAVVIVGIACSIYGVIAARKRREGLFEFLKQLDQGENRHATNIISGTYRQNQVQAFDYHYETHTYDKNGRHTQHHWFSFFILTFDMRLAAGQFELNLQRLVEIHARLPGYLFTQKT